MFASELEMGYDPSVTLCDDLSNYIYRFNLGTVNERAFRTHRCIVEYRPLCITGRNTRVWEAVEVDSRSPAKEIGSRVALRDVWLDENALTEREIQSKIFSDIDKFGEGDMNQSPCFQKFIPERKKETIEIIQTGDYKKYFLTIECDYQGHTSKALAPSAVPTSGLFLARKPETPSPTKTGSGSLTRLLSSHQAIPPRKYGCKRQYRLVYNELCQALHDLEDSDDLSKILSDCLIGMFGSSFRVPRRRN
jgi:hypothetical protein